MDGITANEVEEKMHPNEGIRRSAHSFMIAALLIGLVAGLSAGLVYGLGFGGKIIYGMVGGMTFRLAIGLVFRLDSRRKRGLPGGGAAFIQHYVLRLVLALNNHAPLNYVHFLDHAAERILLRKVGGGYIFVHRMLLEYFASLEEEQQRKNDTPRVSQ